MKRGENGLWKTHYKHEYAALAAEIVRRRAETGLGVKAFARRAGWSHSTQSFFERPSTSFPLYRLIDIAEAFGISVSELLQCLPEPRSDRIRAQGNTKEPR